MREEATAKENGGYERRGRGEGGEEAEARGEVIVRAPVVGEYAAYSVSYVLIGREEAREAEKRIEFRFGKKGLDS
jgi:hypothetical protein